MKPDQKPRAPLHCPYLSQTQAGSLPRAATAQQKTQERLGSHPHCSKPPPSQASAHPQGETTCWAPGGGENYGSPYFVPARNFSFEVLKTQVSSKHPNALWACRCLTSKLRAKRESSANAKQEQQIRVKEI